LSRENGADRREYNIAVMVVLALETVTPLGSMAVWRDGHGTVRPGAGVSPHAARLPGEWLGALSDAGVGIDDVDRLAVVCGPGSFTGVRIGMASAQGLALTRGWAVAAVPTLDAMAECWRAVHVGGAARMVVACLDGMRGEVFARDFYFDGQFLVAQGPPVVAVPEALTWPTGHGGLSLVGSGAVRYGARWACVSDDIADVPEPIAAGAARLAAGAEWPQLPPHALQPLYVRRPDVELARERGRPVGS